MAIPECFPVKGRNVPVPLVLPLYFYQHNPPLTLMQKGVVIFGEIIGSKRTLATPGTGFPSKNIPDLVGINFH